MTDLRRVVAEPVVGLSEVIENDATPIASAGRQDNRRRGVSFAGDPGRVEGVSNEEEGHDQNHPTGNLRDVKQDILGNIPKFWVDY